MGCMSSKEPPPPQTGFTTEEKAKPVRTLSRLDANAPASEAAKTVYYSSERMQSFLPSTNKEISCAACGKNVPPPETDEKHHKMVHDDVVEIAQTCFHKDCFKCAGNCGTHGNSIIFEVSKITRSKHNKPEQKITPALNSDFLLTPKQEDNNLLSVWHTNCYRIAHPELALIDHIHCDRCMKLVTDVLDYYNDERFCKTCWDVVFSPHCVVCKQKIEEGEVIEACSRYFHPHHFLCRKCHKVIPNGTEFQEYRGGAFCNQCYKEVSASEQAAASAGVPLKSIKSL